MRVDHLCAGPVSDGEDAAFSIDVIAWAVWDAKSNAKLFVDAAGFHHLALLLARPEAAPDVRTDYSLAQVKAADLVASICGISHWYLKAALEVQVCACQLMRYYKQAFSVVC